MFIVAALPLMAQASSSSGSGPELGTESPTASPTASPTLGFVNTATTPEGRQDLVSTVVNSGATAVEVIQVEGIVSGLSCADGNQQRNLDELSAVAVQNTRAAGVATAEIVSVSTVATCVTSTRNRRQAGTFSFATEIILREIVSDDIIAALVQGAADNTLDFSAAVLVDSAGNQAPAITITTTSGVSATVPVARLTDTSTNLRNLISCPAECLAHDHDGDGDLDHPVVFKGKKSKGKKGAAAATLVDCSTCPIDASAFAGKGKKAKKAKGVKKAGKGKKGKLSAALHTLGVGGTVGAGVLSGAVVFAAAIIAAMYSSKQRASAGDGQAPATAGQDSATDPLLGKGLRV